MMASGKNAKKKRSTGKASVVAKSKPGVNWITIASVVGVVVLIGAIGAIVGVKAHSNKVEADALAPFTPSASNNDPSTKIDGIKIEQYKSAIHVSSTQRVAYDASPPMGGPHDQEWAACNGVVYPVAMRDENMVHTLEHGAVWITYNPSTIAAGDLDILKGLVQGQTYITLSPYPTLDQPISLQSWGHQLKLSSASDPRVKEFITALRLNQYEYPEIGATCDQPTFPTSAADITAAGVQFDPSPRDSSAVPLDGGTIAPATSEMDTAPTVPPATTSAASSSVPAAGSSAPAAGSSVATSSS